MRDKLGEQQESTKMLHSKEVAMLRQEIIEKEKRLEVINFEYQEEIKIQTEMKDTEIRQI